MNKQEMRQMIAQRVAQELESGDLVNLGIGMPTLVAEYVDPDKHVVFQSENGMTGIGGSPVEGSGDPDLTDAGGVAKTAVPGAAYFDSGFSFALIRGGHVDVTVLGAMEVDRHGNLANYMIPGKLVAGMGGAMDLVNGARKVIIMMEHCNKNGDSKILNECTLPCTAKNQVNLIITELAVIEVVENGLLLKEVAPHSSTEEVIRKTATELIIPDYIRTMGEK